MRVPSERSSGRHEAGSHVAAPGTEGRRPGVARPYGDRPGSDTLRQTTDRTATDTRRVVAIEAGAHVSQDDGDQARELAERLKRLPEDERAAILASLRERSGDGPSTRADGGSAEEAFGVRRSGPLTHAQERLWFLHRLDPGSATYNLRIARRLSGPLDVDALTQAFATIQGRHPVLTTSYPDVDGVPRQVVTPTDALPFTFVDRVGAPASTVDELLADAVDRPFDLAHGPVWRVLVVRTAPDVHILVIVIHHIAADGWSIPILVAELEEIYRATRDGRAPALPDLPMDVIDLARRQRARLDRGDLDEGLAYWVRRLAPPLTALDLPTDRPRPPTQTSNGAMEDVTFDDLSIDDLEALAREARTTPSIVWLALFTAFLSRYTGSSDIVVGGPSAERDTPETEGLIGFLVNTLAYRTSVDPSQTFRDLLGRVRETALDAYRHRDVPFERIVMDAGVEREPSRSPIFQVMYQYGGLFERPLRLPGVTDEPVDVAPPASKFDLELDIAVRDDAALGRMTYNRDLFDRDTIRRMMRHLSVFVHAAVSAPDTALEDLALMDEAESRRMIDTMSGTPSPRATETVLDAIERWATSVPEATALRHGDTTVSYGELLDRSGHVASHLRDVGVVGGDRVVVALERGPDLIAGFLGVMRAGAAYIPVEPSSPGERVSVIIEDARPTAIVSDRDLGAVNDLLRVDPARCRTGRCGSAHADGGAAPAAVDDPAYVIYTSGSTGRPKGVVVDHGALRSFTIAASDLYGLTPDDRVLQFHSPAFDTSVEEIFCTLTTGGTLALRTDDMLGSISAFLAEVERLEISVLDLPTAFWNVMAADILRRGVRLPPCVRCVVFGGEAADPELVRRWIEAYGATPGLINGYGPTETTVTSTAAVLSEMGAPTNGPVTIGRPLASAAAYVTLANGHPAPIGVRGELWIGGSQVARGYLGDADLTADRFIPDPFDRTGRVYRTGDIARWRADGNLEFVGRADRQLKVRGFRVEPGEIEARIVGHEDVEVAFVDLWGQGADAALVAWVVPAPGRTPTADSLDGYLRAVLPDYMVPAIEVIDELPRNQSDKVDVDRLPPPTRTARTPGGPPTGEAMIAMAAIWQDVLGIDHIAASDRFFDLGGHSLLAVEMISRVEREFRTAVPLSGVFSHPSLDEFTRFVSTIESDTARRDLVAIRSTGSRPPLICLPMMEGTILPYERLTRHLDPEVPIVGPHAKGADGRTTPLRTVDEMGVDFAERILASGPGPYRLLGASYAGLLALETAASLTDRGGEVELVVLLDTVLPAEVSWSERQARRIEAVRMDGSSGVRTVARDLWTSTRIRLGRMRHAPRWGVREIAGRPLPSALAGKRMTHVSLAAEHTFHPRVYEGDVLYFRASDDETRHERRDVPWHAYLTSLEVVDSEGGHWGEGSMLDEPHLTDLCRELNARLARLDLDGGTP
jgi:amino acid adenylation domain-containing protein